MAANALIPAMVSFNLKGKEINITGYQLSMKADNGCYYHESVSNKTGGKNYTIHKGADVRYKGEICVTVLKTPDGKFDKSIEELTTAQKDTKNNDPKKYTHPMLFCMCSNDKEPFTKIGFTGYVRDVKTTQDPGAGFPRFEAIIEIYDSTSVAIKK